MAIIFGERFEDVNVDNLAQVRVALRRGLSSRLSDDFVADMLVGIGEVITNDLRYGNKGDHPVSIRISLISSLVNVCIEANSHMEKRKELSLAIAEAENSKGCPDFILRDGGLGLHFVSAMSTGRIHLHKKWMCYALPLNSQVEEKRRCRARVA